MGAQAITMQVRAGTVQHMRYIGTYYTDYTHRQTVNVARSLKAVKPNLEN